MNVCEGSRVFFCIFDIIVVMKTVIWDFNGTILNDLQLCIDVENQMLAKRGLKADYTPEEYRELFCFPVIEYYYKIGYTFENETYEDISVEFSDLYDSGFDSCTLVEGFEDKIRESIEKGYRNVILSASRHEALLNQCHQLHIAHYFDEILGMDNALAASKVDMAKRWMESSDVSPGECIYIGDTDHDYETAEALGIENCVLAACGHQSYDVLKRKTDNVVHSLKEVIL